MNILKPHISLNVTDLEASVRFYERLFEVPASKRRPGYAKFDLQSPALNLSMQEAPRTGVNASHFGIQVATTADVERAQQRLAAAGLRTQTEESTTCCYAVQDKVWVEDPDGNAWEVFVVKADADTMGQAPFDGPRGDVCCTPSIAAADPVAKAPCCTPKRATP